MVPKDLFHALVLAGPAGFRQIRLGQLSRPSGKHSLHEFFYFQNDAKCDKSLLIRKHVETSKKV